VKDTESLKQHLRFWAKQTPSVFIAVGNRVRFRFQNLTIQLVEILSLY